MNNNQMFLDNKFNQVSRLIPPNKTFKILDIGCNNGDIRNFFPDCIYFGIDINKKFISQLQKQGVKARIADLNTQNIPFQFEKFDYILLLDILEHVINPKQLLEKSKEKLSTKGKLIITLPNDYHILNKIRFLLNKDIIENPFHPYGHLHIFPIKSGEDFLKKNGFRILKKIFIPPIKPSLIPQSIKNFLGKKFPQNFSRDILYLLEPLKN